ncbi:MAG: phytoene/squalene synthase family protein [Caldilineaceae bacterium]|nr:phytoene/squalene synthase family protein [Caldilineaceae bacterium]
MMALHTHTWEHDLLTLAYEAMQHHATRYVHPHDDHAYDAATLAQAYRHCAAITATHSRSFYLASALLPRAKRQAVRALYAFCRVTDDIVDSAAEGQPTMPTSAADDGTAAAKQLQEWRQRLLQRHLPTDDPVAVAWTAVRCQYHVPHRYVEQLFDGVGRDLIQQRYTTFDELAAYCYGVASTVGLMSMHIIGYAGDEAIPHAIKLGVALQMTNILRDIPEDLRMGRVYLPQDELAAFDLDDDYLAAGIVTPRWQRFMRFQIERNRQLYCEALPGIALLESDGRFAIRAAAELYRAILDDIEARAYDVFSGRAHISTAGKLRQLPGIWWRSQRGGRAPL